MRLASVDFMRVVAMCGVIVIHTKPFEQYESSVANYLFVLGNQGARFAVPFFFIVAGYLWMEKTKGGNSLCAISMDYAKRIMWVFVFWSFIYGVEAAVPVRLLLNYGVASIMTPLQEYVRSLWESPGAFLFQGSRGHLWFLPALLCAVLITAAFLHLKLQSLLLPVATGLYLFGVLAGSYSSTPVGISVPFRSYLGPFVGTLFFVLGTEASRRDLHVSIQMAVLIFVAGFVAHMLEVLWLWQVFHVAPAVHDHLFGTVLFGVGAAAIALAKPVWGNGTLLAKWGPYMLGVYVVHVLFVDIMSRFRINHVLWDVAFPVAVFGAALGFTVLAARSRLVKPFVV